MCGVSSTKSPLPVLVCALATPPVEPSPQADETVFKRVDRANLTVGTGNPPDHLLDPEQCGARVSRPIPNGEEESACMILITTSGKGGELLEDILAKPHILKTINCTSENPLLIPIN